MLTFLNPIPCTISKKLFLKSVWQINRHSGQIKILRDAQTPHPTNPILSCIRFEFSFIFYMTNVFSLFIQPNLNSPISRSICQSFMLHELKNCSIWETYQKLKLINVNLRKGLNEKFLEIVFSSICFFMLG